MGVVPRQFFCSACRRMRWPGDCEHRRTIDDFSSLSSVVLKQSVHSDVCGGCLKRLRECSCHDTARARSQRLSTEPTLARVRALVGCTCPHHVAAYLADDVAKTVKCGACCRPARILLSEDGTATVALDSDRIPVRLSVVRDAFAWGDKEHSRGSLFFDPDAPGWISNGHWLAFVGTAGVDTLSKEFASERRHLAKTILEEEGDRGVSVYWRSVTCEPKEAPVEMIGWRTDEERERNVPYPTIIAPAYNALLSWGSPTRSGTEALSPVKAWGNNKLVALVMPRRETIIE